LSIISKMRRNRSRGAATSARASSSGALGELGNPGAEFRKCDYEAFRTGAHQLAKKHFPQGMATKMLLKPLGGSLAVGRVVVPTMTSVARLLVR
jgi:hypothetical protein